MKNGLDQIPHRPGHQGVIGIVVRGERLLVIRRSEHVVAPGRYCFPGGGIEPGETQNAALVREFDEELSVKIRPRRFLWQSETPWQVELFWWQVELDSPDEPVANPQEVESIHWLTFDEILERENEGLPSNRAFIEACRSGEFALL